MSRKLEVNYWEWHRIRNAVTNMQGKIFYCEDDQGGLRRWYPPAVPEQNVEDDD